MTTIRTIDKCLACDGRGFELGLGPRSATPCPACGGIGHETVAWEVGPLPWILLWAALSGAAAALLVWGLTC